jgi:hypothetical protein
LLGHPAIEGRSLFVNVPKDNPAAAWMEVNYPFQGFAQIQELERDGFLVRTRGDEPTEEVRANDVRMRDPALASGGQFVSSDFPMPNLKFSPYWVRLEGNAAALSNPVDGLANLRGRDLEK